MINLLLGLCFLIFSSTSFASTQTSGYYCQVDIPGTISGYFDVYYRMTARKAFGLRHFSAEVERVKSNLLAMEENSSFAPLKSDGTFITLGAINLFSETSSVGSLSFEVSQSVDVIMNFTSFEYDVKILNAVIRGKASEWQNTNARCQRMSNQSYLNAIK